MELILYILYILVQCTWGLPQTLIGLVVFLIHRKAPHHFHKGCIHTDWDREDGVSLGLFTFVPEGDEECFWYPQMCDHEYGHTLQSLMLGPLYLLIVGLPSMLWNQLPYYRKKRRKLHRSYYSFWPERWADRLGKVIR